MAGMEKIAANPLMGSAAIGQIYSAGIFGTELKTIECIEELLARAKDVNRGNLSSVEDMLVGQAAALNAMFNHYAHRAALTEGGLRVQETLIRVALKAQVQCRATLQTLAEIKNPRPVAFVKQANIAHGHQQINNVESLAPAHARENESAQNELLEVKDGERLDTRAPGKAINADPAMATLGKIDGATHA